MTRGIYQRVGVHEDALGELCEAPAVQLGEGHSELGSRQQLQVVSVVTVMDVHYCHHVIQLLQMMPTNNTTDIICSHHVAAARPTPDDTISEMLRTHCV